MRVNPIFRWSNSEEEGSPSETAWALAVQELHGLNINTSVCIVDEALHI